MNLVLFYTSSYEEENFGKGVNYRRKYKTTKYLK